MPISIGLIVDHAIVPRDRAALLLSIAGLLLLFTVLSFAYRFGARRMNTALQLEAHDLRVEVARHALLSRGALDGRRPGAVLSLSSADADVAAMIFRQLASGGSALIGIAGASAYLLWVDLPVGLVVILGVPLALLVVAGPSRAISRRSGDQQAAVAEAGAVASDTMGGLRILKAIGGERWASQRYHRASADAAAAGVRTADVSGRVSGLGALGVGVILAGVVLMAGWRVTTGDLSVGQLVSVIGVAVFFSEPIQTLTMTMTVFARSHGAAGKIADFLGGGRSVEPTGPLPTGSAIAVDSLDLGTHHMVDLRISDGVLCVLDVSEPAAALRLARALSGWCGRRSGPRGRLPPRQDRPPPGRVDDQRAACGGSLRRDDPFEHHDAPRPGHPGARFGARRLRDRRGARGGHRRPGPRGARGGQQPLRRPAPADRPGPCPVRGPGRCWCSRTPPVPSTR